jgi:hypothetical protein
MGCLTEEHQDAELMEKIDFSKLINDHHNEDLSRSTSESWLEFMLLHLTSNRLKDDFPAVIMKGEPPYIIDVELKINGVEMVFSDIVKILFVSFHQHVEQRAKAIVEEKLGDVLKVSTEQIRKIFDDLEKRLTTV